MRSRFLLPFSLAALAVGLVAGSIALGCGDDAETHSYIGAIDPDAAPPRIGPPPDAGGDGD